jgi:hypothetical protein
MVDHIAAGVMDGVDGTVDGVIMVDIIGTSETTVTFGRGITIAK